MSGPKKMAYRSRVREIVCYALASLRHLHQVALIKSKLKFEARTTDTENVYIIIIDTHKEEKGFNKYVLFELYRPSIAFKGLLRQKIDASCKISNL